MDLQPWKIDGKAAGKKATVTVKDQTIKIAFAEASVKADAGKSIEVTFKAKIKDGANLAAYITPAGTTEIPNKLLMILITIRNTIRTLTKFR